MKICIVGASGLLGEGFQHISKDTKNEFIFCYTKNKIPNAIHLDITKEDMVKSFFQIHKPDALINCSAITDLEFCEKNKSLASNVNTLGAKRLAQACNIHGSHMIHISTEYIFDGNTGPYQENDVPKPISYYGQTKLESEKVVLKENQNFCGDAHFAFSARTGAGNLILIIPKLTHAAQLTVGKTRTYSSRCFP